MEFRALVQKVGPAMAIAICGNKITRAMWNKLTFNQLLKVCEDSDQPELQKRAFNLAVKKANSKEQCYRAYNTIEGDHKLESKILRRLLGIVRSFDDCTGIERYTAHDPRLRKDVVSKALWLAQTVDECFTVYNATDDLDNEALNKAFRLSKTMEEYRRLLNATTLPDNLKAKISKIMLKAAESTSDCLEAWSISDDDNVRAEALRQAMALAESPEDWLHIRYLNGNPGFRKKLLENAVSRINTLEDGAQIYEDLDPNDTEARTRVMERIREIVNINTVTA